MIWGGTFTYFLAYISILTWWLKEDDIIKTDEWKKRFYETTNQHFSVRL